MGGALWTAGRRRWASDLFTASLARLGGPGGKDGLQLSRRKPKSSKAGFVQRPQNAPLKNRIKAQN